MPTEEITAEEVEAAEPIEEPAAEAEADSAATEAEEEAQEVSFEENLVNHITALESQVQSLLNRLTAVEEERAREAERKKGFFAPVKTGEAEDELAEDKTLNDLFKIQKTYK